MCLPSCQDKFLQEAGSMNFNITDISDQNEEQFIIQSLWSHNSGYEEVDIRPLRITMKKETGDITGGLIARTWWGGLEVQYLWVNENYRKQGFGSQLMQTAEQEAIKRECHMAYVDTFSFQALEFYRKLGYSEYGSLSGFAHKFHRYYLSKKIM